MTGSLQHYRQLTQGGKVTVNLSPEEAAVTLKAYDDGVAALTMNERLELDRVIAKLKDQLWP
jgi:hypothetical protein